MKPSRAIASFDSASTMLRVLARHLRGRDSPALGLGGAAQAAGLALPAMNRLPTRVRGWSYARAGQWEAVAQRRLADIDTENIAQWVTDHYPRRRYPVVLIGSASGAVAHLAALAGVPWLPQTLFVPVRHDGLDPDDPRRSLAALSTAGTAFTKANPGIGLSHMHDPNQDRLMIRRMAYFRFKYQSLPHAYAAFLGECLEPGGTVLVVNCAQQWPGTTVGARHVFQHGAVGGASAEEYQQGGPRVNAFLAEHHSPHRQWSWPTADAVHPESEWGFDPALLTDLDDLCTRGQWKLEQLRFPRPQALSHPVAELHRDFYAERGLPANRLLVDCFALIDVRQTLRRGLVPYWVPFSTRPAVDGTLEYLRDAPPYDDIHVGLFSHGTRSIGLAGIRDWNAVLHHARLRHAYCGVDTQAFPRDFASNVRFHRHLAALDDSGDPPAADWPWIRAWLRRHTSAEVEYLPDGH